MLMMSLNTEVCLCVFDGYTIAGTAPACLGTRIHKSQLGDCSGAIASSNPVHGHVPIPMSPTTYSRGIDALSCFVYVVKQVVNCIP